MDKKQKALEDLWISQGYSHAKIPGSGIDQWFPPSKNIQPRSNDQGDVAREDIQVQPGLYKGISDNSNIMTNDEYKSIPNSKPIDKDSYESMKREFEGLRNGQLEMTNNETGKMEYFERDIGNPTSLYRNIETGEAPFRNYTDQANSDLKWIDYFNRIKK